jgi:hypothetical protein
MSRFRLRAVTLFAFLSLLFSACATSFTPFAAAAESSSRITWTEAPGAQVKLGGKIPIMWGLYQPDKKDKKKDKEDLVLVLLGRRYLLIDVKEHAAYEVKLEDLKAEGKNFTSDEGLASTSRMIPTTDWSIRDVGAFEKVDLTLGDYGSDLELQLPHPLILTPPLHYVY